MDYEWVYKREDMIWENKKKVRGGNELRLATRENMFRYDNL